MPNKTTVMLDRRHRAGSILLVLFVAGCGSPHTGSSSTKSRFYEQCRDVGTMMERCVTDKEVVLENHKQPASAVEGGHTGLWHNKCSFVCNVHCTDERIGQFMQSFRAELRKAAQQAGAELTVEGEGSAQGSQQLGMFEIEYALGTAHGEVTVNVDAGKAEPDKPGTKVYKLVVKTDEWVH
ncbi:MAG: hypothetical protein NTW87_27435 [Planctomycetota bacterium]|nr:hypothetical protein [Planctomycetota bacterium]